MSVMALDIWRQRTFAHMRNKPRSALVISIDGALTNYHTTKSAPSLQALRTIVDPLDTSEGGIAESMQVRDAIADLKESLKAEVGSGALEANLYPPAIYGTAYKAFRAGITMVHISPTYAKAYAPWTQKTSVDWGVSYQDFGPSNAIMFLRKVTVGAGQLTSRSRGHGFIEVRVPLKPAAGTVFSALAKTTWDQAIRSTWSGVKLKAGKETEYTLDIGIEWCDSGDAWANEITAVATPPMPAPADWRQAKTQASVHRSGTSVGTPHMSQFGTGDRQAVLHEFGHLLGNPDEYNTRQFMGVDVSGYFDENPFTTNSIMNNTSQQGLLFARHYYPIKAFIEEWLGLPEDSTQVWWPGMLDGKPSKSGGMAVV